MESILVDGRGLELDGVFQVPSTPFWDSVTWIFSAGERKGTASHQRLCRGFPARSPVSGLGAGCIAKPVGSFPGCLEAAALTTEPGAPIPAAPAGDGEGWAQPRSYPFTSCPMEYGCALGVVQGSGMAACAWLQTSKWQTWCGSQCTGTGGRMLPRRGEEGLERIRDTCIALAAGTVVVLFFCAGL